ncbi:MAG TPA: DUF3047 domain-containing protein [Gemmatimonadales bacterium]|nr:DUF3047 domain-containing protein [Gemmatimonadales bacterium]
MTGTTLTLLQALTNLSLAPASPGLPSSWLLQRVPGVAAPLFSVTAEHTLRVAAVAAAGIASYRLRAPLRPQPGTVSWRWRTATPLHDAVLRRHSAEAAPVRVVLAFADGRTLLYSWGERESRGEHFPSPTGARRGVVVLERAEDADGSWHLEQRDPFADYQVVFNRAPRALVAAGVGADTQQVHGRTVAEVGELSWDGGARP